MRRTLPLLLLVTTTLLPLAVASAQDASPPNPPPFDRAVGGNAVPPGQSGHIPSAALVQALAGTYQDPNIDEQRDLYVDWQLKDFSFARPGEPLAAGADPRDALGEPYNPAGRADAIIYRDGWGVPRIFAETDAAAQFAIGYAMAEDRLFQADIFRHVARGTMAGFYGGQEWYDYDRAWTLEFYTDAELMAQFEAYYTAEEQGLVQAYADGINAYIAEAMQDPEKMPAEYPALQLVPEPWQVTDSLAVFVLQARDSVEGFGKELYNASLLGSLRAQHGREAGDRIFRDVRFLREPGATTTTPAASGVFPYPGGGFEGLDAPGVILPDDPAQALAVAAHDDLLATTLDRVGFGRRQASNAITVSPDLTADGQPILLGGPQLDYLVPGIFWEFEAHSPRQHVRGIGFAGTAGAILIGKSAGHAWSISYGYTDQIDVFLVPLDPAAPDTRYLRDGASHDLQTYDVDVPCKAVVSGFASPGAEDLCDGLPVNQTTVTVQRVPEYGPIIGRVDAEGAPHAVVKVRAHWNEEVRNGKPFIAMNTPGTIDDFRAAQTDFNISINLHYVDDDGHFGYWHVARPPIRAQGTDVRLPTRGTGAYDWQGFVPLDDVPHAIDPAQGYTVNWNNQVSEGWHNGDQNSWGELQRVDMLASRMEALAARGDITTDDIWQVNREAAFEDGRWADFPAIVLGAFEGATGLDAPTTAALDLLRSWDGQRTATRIDGTWVYDDAAVAFWDPLLRGLQAEIMSDELGGGYYASIDSEFTPNFYHLKSTLLLRFLRQDGKGLTPEHDWLGGRSPEEVIRDVVDATVAQLVAEQGDDPSVWRRNASTTSYRAVGLASVDSHPNLNRGTFNELLSMQRDPALAETTPPPAPAPLPATGGGLALVGAMTLAGALVARRTRRSPAL